MTTFNLPDLGEGLAEAEIVRWHVEIGDRVTVDQPMLAVETAKAVVEVPAPYSGVVRALHGQPGDMIATGAPLVEFELDRDDSGTVVGSMPTSDEELIETALAGRNDESTPDAMGGVREAGSFRESVRAAPAARALAKKLGVDLAGMRGSGRGGVITVDDVITAAPGRADAAVAAAPKPTEPGAEKLRGLRRAMAQSMSLARDNVMSCTLFDDADLHRWREGEDVTTRLLRAIVAGCQVEPALNAWFEGESQTRRLLADIDVGIAVDTPDGLIVPVIRNAGGRSVAELRLDIDRLKRTARDRSVAPEELRDFSFLLSNFGMIAGRYATPVVVPPAVAILGSGRLSRDVIATADGIEAHRRMPLSLTFDHRCVTGGEAARFLAAVLRDLERDT
jgi:2-oxoisovalerate dehydrogenase E2 component (dihydrolipoyl transacylase)